MFKFNSENIFVGHIKQLLASFNLPKYHVYTEEQAEYHKKYLEAKNNLESVLNKITDLNQQINKETDEEKRAELIRQQYDLKELYQKYEKILAAGPEKNILITVTRNIASSYTNTETYDQAAIYPTYMRYIPYIKDNNIQIYAPKFESGKLIYSDNDWKEYHATYGTGHSKIHTKNANLITPKGYVYNLKIRNYTKNLKIQNNVYDSYTHEYLGDYLRFQRDYRHVNMMSLYNCFSNRLCPRLKLKFDVYKNSDGTTGYTTSFDTDDTKYKIYMVPVKLFKQYTIAIDCMSDVEMCCGFYNQYQYPEAYNEIALKTYKCFNSLTFGEPVLFDKVLELNSYLSVNHPLELAQHEQDLKLFIKLPVNNNSSIVILEGDYTAYANTTLIKYHPSTKAKNEIEDTTLNMQNAVELGGNWYEATLEDGGVISLQSNDLLYSTTEVADGALTMNNFTTQRNERSTNDGQSFVVLTNHTELNLDGDIKENLKHLSSPLQLLSQNTGVSYPFADRLIEFLVDNMITPADNISDNIARAKKVVETRTNMLNSTDGIWEDKLQLLLYNYMTKHYDRLSNYHDILGYVDKDTERIYSNGSPTKKETIASADIYNDWED